MDTTIWDCHDLTISLTGNTLASSYAPPPPRTSGPSATQSTFGTQMSQS